MNRVYPDNAENMIRKKNRDYVWCRTAVCRGGVESRVCWSDHGAEVDRGAAFYGATVQMQYQSLTNRIRTKKKNKRMSHRLRWHVKSDGGIF